MCSLALGDDTVGCSLRGGRLTALNELSAGREISSTPAPGSVPQPSLGLCPEYLANSCHLSRGYKTVETQYLNMKYIFHSPPDVLKFSEKLFFVDKVG